jgi:cytochrome c2
MLKISAVLGVLGLGLLLLSVLPLPGLAPETASAPAASTAVPPASAAASQPDAAYGQALFSAKGCVMCHHHAAVAKSDPFDMGNPDLTKYRPDPEFLRRWLKDPKSVRPATEMPNLGLQQAEIEALIAFLSANQTGG